MAAAQAAFVAGAVGDLPHIAAGHHKNMAKGRIANANGV